MEGARPLEELLRRPDLWRPAHHGAVRRTISTGCPALDDALGGGWPLGQLTEFCIPAHGIGELRLLLPAINQLDRRVMLVSPPHIPYAPALEALGVDLARLLLVNASTTADALWALEQGLRSRSCSVVIGWVEQAGERVLRRLQLAAEAGGCWAMLFRPVGCLRRRSPAPLRIELRVAPADAGLAGLELRILKQRAGLPARVLIPAVDA